MANCFKCKHCLYNVKNLTCEILVKSKFKRLGTKKFDVVMSAFDNCYLPDLICPCFLDNGLAIAERTSKLRKRGIRRPI